MKMVIKNNAKINNNIKLTLLMTIIIMVVLIILPIVFLNRDVKLNLFNVNDNSVVKNSKISFPIDGKVKLYMKEENKVEELDLETYVMGVVASEVPANFSEEALKAQAVAARTYYMNKRNNSCEDSKKNNAEICDTTNCQVYMSKEKRIESWSKSKAEENWSKIQKAVEDTKGEILTYEGNVLEYPQFFSTSSGRTEAAKDAFSVDVPYLKSEESKGEESAPKYESTVELPIEKFVSEINKKYPHANLDKKNLNSKVNIKSYTDGGGVKEIQIGDEVIRGTEFRTLLGLNSSNFSISVNKTNISIKCKGYGHGVGMSQWGANAMAKDGATYKDILEHYYDGVKIEKINYTKN